MSIHISSQVWKWKAPDVHAKVVMLKLADNANDEGVCWPSLQRIAGEGCLSRSTVCDRLSWLEAQGIISRQPGGARPGERGGKTTTYQIHLAKLSAVRSSPPDGRGGSPPDGRACSPQHGLKPSRQNHQKKPPLQATPPASQGRVCDLAFEMLVKVQKGTLDGMTKNERGAINTALKAIRETAPPGTTAEQLAAEIKRRAAAYHEKFSENTIITAMALAKYWSQLGKWGNGARRERHPLDEVPAWNWEAVVREIAVREGWDITDLEKMSWRDFAPEHRKLIVDAYERKRAEPIPAYDRFAREVMGWSPAEGLSWACYKETGSAREMLAKWATMTDEEKRPYMTPPVEPGFAWREFVEAKFGAEIVVEWRELNEGLRQEITVAWNRLAKSEQDGFALASAK